MFEALIEEPLREGKLQRVLQDWCPHDSGLYLYYPSKRQLPPTFKAFMEFVRQYKWVKSDFN
ncbi:LysR substrate-binding domain-containing protein [Acinetobacter junii]|uniref:LysR substrate-binding domain-containing protein n=1 Tax=Acinetobacter TaxID=469 RepID=UPI00124F9D38